MKIQFVVTLLATIFVSDASTCKTGDYITGKSDQLFKQFKKERTFVDKTVNFVRWRLDPIEPFTKEEVFRICECIGSKAFEGERVVRYDHYIQKSEDKAANIPEYRIAECKTEEKPFYIHRGLKAYTFSDHKYDFYVLVPNGDLQEAQTIDDLKYVGCVREVDLKSMKLNLDKWHKTQSFIGGPRENLNSLC